MENVPGIPSALPLLPAYPATSIRKSVSANDWHTFTESWIFSIDYRLRLTPGQFSYLKLSHPASGAAFLASYLQQYILRVNKIESGSQEAQLHHRCYFLLKRLLLATSVPYDCSVEELFTFLAAGSVAFHAIADWKSTLKSTWKRAESQVKAAIESQKHALIQTPSLKESNVSTLRQTTALVRCLSEAAVVAITGSDYLEAIMKFYSKGDTDVRTVITETIYVGLRNLMSDGQKRTSLLLDILFELKSGSDQAQKLAPNQPTLLTSLVCTTAFLRHLQTDQSTVAGKRGQALVETLSEYRKTNAHLHPVTQSRSRRRSKGKQKAPGGPADDMHIHKASQISQIYDLFPDLSTDYTLKLLDHFSDNVEAVIAGLLEPSSLPQALQDSSAQNDIPMKVLDDPYNTMPHQTPPSVPGRKSVFDNDAFDRLQITSSQIHRGRKELTDQPQTTDEKSRSKAAIMAALAAFDADDDERDDTYDVADVGGAVDNTLDSDEQRDLEFAQKNEEILFRAWLETPLLFARDSKTRMSNARRQLRDDTHMGDEQIEGWNIMLSRDSKMEDRLRQKYSVIRTFQGNQSSVVSTKWRANASSSGSEDEESANRSDGRRVGAAGIRGARIWNSGRGRGSTSGNPNDHATQMARKRKEQGRGRGGANQRRDGRAKKMGRGMGPAPG